MIKTLSGRTVLITRPLDARDELAGGLEANGARIVWCPTIEITEPESFAALDAAINDLFGYDWIIFTSANGVEYFGRRAQALGHHLAELDDVRVCAIGEATAEKLRDVAVHVDLVPGEAKAEGVYRALCDYLGSAAELRTLNFLLPRAAVARDYLPRVLTDAGARVDDVAAYRTVAPESSDLGRIKALLDGGGIDCVTFTSSSTVRNFAKLFDVTELGPLLGGANIACIGGVTAQTAHEFGLTVTIQPAETSLAALANAISDHFTGVR
ncbi:MAG: uroporphyrinogen-III synthase [Pyrinomonadaceae bacterium]